MKDSRYANCFNCIRRIIVAVAVLSAVFAIMPAEPVHADTNIATTYISEMEFDDETGYYIQKTVTTSIYYDSQLKYNVKTTETIISYYNYDGNTYTLVTTESFTNVEYIEPATPAPTMEPTRTPRPQIIITPEPSATPAPTSTPYPTQTPVPVKTPYPVMTPLPVRTPEPSVKPKQTAKPYNYNDIYDTINFKTNKITFTVKRKSDSKAQIIWKVNGNADGYYIYRSLSESGKYKKIKTIKDCSVKSYNDNGLKPGKLYYYKVQAYAYTQDGVITTNMPAAEQVSTLKTQTIMNKLKKLKKKYPDGMYWNHVGYRVSAGQSTYGYVTRRPCNHRGVRGGVASTCNSYSVMLDGRIMRGYQCYGFANLIGDKLFGKTKIKTHYSYDKAKVGDHVRYGGHSVVVIEKHPNYIKVAECNIGGTCMIKWGRKISRTALSRATYYTRY